MKKNYIQPCFEVEKLTSEDILSVSDEVTDEIVMNGDKLFGEV